MTTTVRSVRVELEAAVTGYIRDIKLAGSETDRAFSGVEERLSASSRAVSRLEKNTSNLAKTSADARVQQSTLGREVDKTTTSANRGGSSIDKYSGRLRTLLDVTLLLGPAVLRLGAGALPVLTAGAVGLGAAAGGIGVTVLALHGLGDALDALNKYQLDRTDENLRAVRIQMENLGPAGAHFVRELDRLGPTIHTLQLMARAGILPGLEDDLDALATRLPFVQRLVTSLSNEVGDLASDAGSSLASDKWTPFFNYVESQAAPTLDAFARSAGNVALGLANILVAFDPLTRRFTGGLEDMTSRFAEWSQHLEDDKGFQDFLHTVEEAGPELVDFLGATVGLFTGIARASAPLASVTLPILTGIVGVLGSIANSKVGPVIYTAAAAWTFYSRAASLAEKSSERISKSWDGMSSGAKAGRAAAGIALLATALTDYDDKAGLANTATLGLTTALAGGGPLAIGAGITVGLLLDIAHANDDLGDSTRSAQDALNSLDTTQMQDSLQKLRDEIQETDDAASPNRFGPGDGFQGLSGSIDFLGSAWSKLTGEQDDARQTADELADALARPPRVIASTTPIIGGLVNSLEDGAYAAQHFSDALAELNGYFDKRDAILNYKDAIDQLTKGLKDGFNREDLANINSAGRSILQVADQIQNPKKRAEFLAGARADLQRIADHAGPEAAAAVQKVIDKFDSKGLTNPPPIKLTADQKSAEEAFANTRRDLHDLNVERAEPKIDADDAGARHTINGVKGLMDDLDGTRAHPRISADPGNSLSLIGQIRAALNGLHDRTINVRVNRLGGVTSSAGGHTAPGIPTADGGTVPGQRAPYGDKVLMYAAPGEEVITNRHGEADQYRADRAAGRIPAYAGGGTVEDRINSTYTSNPNPFSVGYQPFDLVSDAALGAAKGLKGLEKQSHRLEKQQDRLEAKRDALQSRYDDIRSSTTSLLTSNLFEPSEGSDNPWMAGAKPGGLMDPFAVLQGDIANATLYDQLVAQLKQRGLGKDAIAEIASHGTSALQLVAGYSDSDLSRFQQLYTTRAQLVGTAATDTAQAVVGKKLDGTNDRLDRLLNRVELVEDAIKQASKENKDAQDKGAKKFADAVNGAASSGHTRGL